VRTVPPGARVMINDPARLYYYTGIGGVVLPNESPDVIPEIALKYGVRYLVLEEISADGKSSDASPEKLWPILRATPDFLVPISINIPNVKVYEIRY
jgi:hypothetical protein